MGFDRLHPSIQHHVVNSLGWRDLRPLQEEAVDPILDGDSCLLIAPTAGGKTEAAVAPDPLANAERVLGWPERSLCLSDSRSVKQPGGAAVLLLLAGWEAMRGLAWRRWPGSEIGHSARTSRYPADDARESRSNSDLATNGPRSTSLARCEWSSSTKFMHLRAMTADGIC